MSSFHGVVPKRKKRRRHTAGVLYPLPVPIRSHSGFQSNCLTWHHYTGYLSAGGGCVSVQDNHDMTSLFEMGFFGKGSLSRSKPEYNVIPGDNRMSTARRLHVVSKRRYLRHLKWKQTYADQDPANVTIDTISTIDTPHSTARSQKPKAVSSEDTLMPDSNPASMLVDTDTAQPVVQDPWAVDTEAENATFWINSATSDLENDAMKGSNVKGAEHSTRSGGEMAEVGSSTSLVQDVPTEAEPDFHPECLQIEDDGDWFVVDGNGTDGDGYKWCPVIKRAPCPLSETLQLSAEEAFFLSYGLGYLTVIDEQQKALNLTEMWRRFCERPNFVERYVAYHYLRSRAWVVKTGLKYGADFLIYKEGPETYHSSYTVIVRTHESNEQTTFFNRRPLTWEALARLNRITEQVSKRILFLHVTRPADLTHIDCLSPACIRRFSVQEVFLQRWVSAHERENT